MMIGMEHPEPSDANKNRKPVAIVGAGPAGLFAAECLLKRGFCVSMYDRMERPGRKLLVAGSRGGLNITNALEPDAFASRYGLQKTRFAHYLSEFSPTDLIGWLSGLGIAVHRGSGGKIFPEGISTPELLSRWMERLRSFPAFSFYPGHRLERIGAEKTLFFATSAGTVAVKPDAAIFSLGGASWPMTGSDGQWQATFRNLGITVVPFQPANCGYEADWPDRQKELFANVPLKNVVLRAGAQGMAEETQARGEIMLTPYGLEGSPIYALGATIRDEIETHGSCTIRIDLIPDRTAESAKARLAGGPGKESLSNFFRKRLGIDGKAYSLVRYAADRSFPDAGIALKDTEIAAHFLKSVPVFVYRPRPIEEAISSAGGIGFAGLDDRLMLKAHPGFFCCGEMLDWEAPTGGYLLQGCFSTARQAALGVEEWLGAREQ